MGMLTEMHPKSWGDCHTSDIGHWFAMTVLIFFCANLRNDFLVRQPLLFETIQYAEVPQAPGAGGNDPGLGNGGAVFLAGRPLQPGHLRHRAVAFPGNRGQFVVFLHIFSKFHGLSWLAR